MEIEENQTAVKVVSIIDPINFCHSACQKLSRARTEFLQNCNLLFDAVLEQLSKAEEYQPIDWEKKLSDYTHAQIICHLKVNLLENALDGQEKSFFSQAELWQEV